jgi:GT2 family glycosyltransferase
MPTERIVSIVVPTFNRRDRLQRCLDKIGQNVATPHEVIVVDGGSTDGTREWLSQLQPKQENPPLSPLMKGGGRVRVIFETRRAGAVAAFNKGFRAATGDYVMWLNDDAYPLPGAVEAAVAIIERPDLTDVGMVAFYHNWHNERNVLDRLWHEGNSYEICHVRGYAYANFGLLRRSLLEKVGFADERFYFFGFDPDLSLKIQINEGLKVIGCRQALIHHDEHHDDRKLADLPTGREDNEKLFMKWGLPAPGRYADPRPAYEEVLRRVGSGALG